MSATVLGKVLEYCKFHAGKEGKNDDENKNFDEKYFNELDTSMLFEVMLVSSRVYTCPDLSFNGNQKMDILIIA